MGENIAIQPKICYTTSTGGWIRRDIHYSMVSAEFWVSVINTIGVYLSIIVAIWIAHRYNDHK